MLLELLLRLLSGLSGVTTLSVVVLDVVVVVSVVVLVVVIVVVIVVVVVVVVIIVVVVVGVVVVVIAVVVVVVDVVTIVGSGVVVIAVGLAVILVVEIDGAAVVGCTGGSTSLQSGKERIVTHLSCSILTLFKDNTWKHTASLHTDHDSLLSLRTWSPGRKIDFKLINTFELLRVHTAYLCQSPLMDVMQCPPSVEASSPDAQFV